jgi:Replication-relaxation
VCTARHAPLLATQIVTWANLREAARTADQRHQRPTPLPTTAHPLSAMWAASSVEAPSAVSGRTPPTDSRWHRVLPTGPVEHPGQVLGPLDRVILDLVGRHPFLPTDNLAMVLDRDVRWARVRRARLLARGLLRVVQAEEVATPELARRGLLELTRDGLQVLAAQLGLPLGAAVRHHGLAGGGPAIPIGPRAALLAHLPHTLGADAVFALLARAARHHPGGGGALLEWRNAAACAHGRLRPDGYGLLRLGQRQYGFFLEFDRGSMRPGRLRAKFVAYHRYRSSAHASRAYAGFPLILVVTTGPGPEWRLARAIRAADAGQAAPLPALLTTTGLLASAPGGPFGCVWRIANNPARHLLTGSGGQGA